MSRSFFTLARRSGRIFKAASCAILLAGMALSSVNDAAASPRTERGDLVYRIVRKWGVIAQLDYGVDVRRWANQMAPMFASASVPRLKKALQADSFEGMNDALMGMAPQASAPRRVTARLLGDPGDSYTFVPIEPCRVVDTRIMGQPLAADSVTSFYVTGTSIHSQGAGNCSIQGDIGAVVVSVTAVQPAGAGYLTVYPDHTFIAPGTANVNYAAGQIVNNQSIVGLYNYNNGAPKYDDKIKVYTYANTHVVIDVIGVFRAANTYKGQLACQDVETTTSSVGLTKFKVDLQCPLFNSMTSIHCNAPVSTSPLSSDVADVTILGSDISSASSFDAGTCFYKNGTSTSVRTKARCCQQISFR